MGDPERTAETSRRLAGAGPTARLTLAGLGAVDGLVHAFTLKDADPRAALRDAAGADLPLATVRQVHGAGVHIVDERVLDAEGAPAGTASVEADALITRTPGVALGIFVADCLPILIGDPVSRSIAAVHAGWRGTVRGVLGATLGTMRARFGARPRDLRVAIGPGIGPCCFEVGEEVVEALLRHDPGAGGCIHRSPRARVDLIEANLRQALAAGVPADRLEAARWCTFCSPGLASFRRDRQAAGRMAGLIGWRA